MADLTPQQLADIRDAVALCYQAAELPQQPERPQVVPLASLLAAWPLAFAEVPGLTRRGAAAYLSQRSGHAIRLEPDADLPLSGLLYAYPYFGEVWGCLLVDKDDRVERRRFSAAHELGHYLLHFRPRIQQQAAQGDYLYLDEGLLRADEGGNGLTQEGRMFAEPSRDTGVRVELDALQMEREANRFAAELLLPEAACRALVARSRARTRVTPRQLATEFLVSTAAMEYRLQTLGLLGRGAGAE